MLVRVFRATLRPPFTAYNPSGLRLAELTVPRTRLKNDIVTTKSYPAAPFSRLLAEAAYCKPDYPVFSPGCEAARLDLAVNSTVEFCGMTLAAPDQVYAPHPNSSTEFVVRNWWAARLDEPTGSLLDLGCGTGALGLYAARQGWAVTCADVGAASIASARHNAEVNKLTADFHVSDLFSDLGRKTFDVILFNLPYLHKAEVSADEAPIADENGKLARRLFDEAAAYLNSGGRLIFTYSNCSNEQVLARDDWNFELIACDYESRGRYWRTLLTGRPVPKSPTEENIAR